MTGRVEDGSGTNSRQVPTRPEGYFDPLGYEPHPGTLNLNVGPRVRRQVMARTPAAHLGGTTPVWEVTLDGEVCHVRVSGDPRTLEVLHPKRLRQTYSNGDQMTLELRTNVSLSIMAHPARQDRVESLVEALGADVPVAYDQDPAWGGPPAKMWAVCRAAWEHADPEADWHVVLQDDVTPVPGLLDALPQVLGSVPPKVVVSLFTATAKPGSPTNDRLRREFDRADRGDAPWVNLPALVWGPALALPTHTIKDMVHFCQTRINQGTSTRLQDDSMISDYYRGLGYRAWHTAPCLVQHLDEDSLIHQNPRPYPRVAVRYHHQDPAALPWGTHPRI